MYNIDKVIVKIILNYMRGLKIMNHQEIKAKSGLALKELSQNELETVVGGDGYLKHFWNGASAFPEML